jgi:hypothetical protein
MLWVDAWTGARPTGGDDEQLNGRCQFKERAYHLFLEDFSSDVKMGNVAERENITPCCESKLNLHFSIFKNENSDHVSIICIVESYRIRALLMDFQFQRHRIRHM